jgi:hypothetical protein
MSVSGDAAEAVIADEAQRRVEREELRKNIAQLRLGPHHECLRKNRLLGNQDYETYSLPVSRVTRPLLSFAS